jgi:hypothetical protein
MQRFFDFANNIRKVRENHDDTDKYIRRRPLIGGAAPVLFSYEEKCLASV